MKIYKCIDCDQVFTRKWNMRKHSRSQHGYDPLPDNSLKRTISGGYEFANVLKKIEEKIEGFPAFAGEDQNLEPRLRNPVNILGKLLDNFVIIKKMSLKVYPLICVRVVFRWSFFTLGILEQNGLQERDIFVKVSNWPHVN